jgi:leader peptidase (prepilin peptidase)/N-methyltransferase
MIVGPGFTILAIVAGAVVGSFATTAGIRLARGEAVAAGRSRCDHCRTTLSFVRTVPAVSFALHRGACHSCGSPIDRTHPIGELVGAAIGLCAITVATDARAILLAALGFVLLTLAVVDAKVQRLPDFLTILVLGLTIGLAWRGPADALMIGLISGGAMFGLLALVRYSPMVLGRAPGLGLGDVKLLAALAVWLGPLAPIAMTAAAVSGLCGFLVLRPGNGRLAFGPFIAASAWIVGMTREAGAWPL